MRASVWQEKWKVEHENCFCRPHQHAESLNENENLKFRSRIEIRVQLSAGMESLYCLRIPQKSFKHIPSSKLLPWKSESQNWSSGEEGGAENRCLMRIFDDWWTFPRTGMQIHLHYRGSTLTYTHTFSTFSVGEWHVAPAKIESELFFCEGSKLQHVGSGEWMEETRMKSEKTTLKSKYEENFFFFFCWLKSSTRAKPKTLEFLT